ncbi:hypothetical protein LCGC14_1574170 [marine sediment metagenome]|uniref:Uncharacterized protein n=1 Tax=marine sediment metagenome TaxID=412755 RepID=A0A0F9J4Z8_9ZZZZ
MSLDVIIRGRFLNSDKEGLKVLILEAYEESAKELEKVAKQGFESSVNLGAIVGQYPDPEALKAILRSIKVEVTSEWPPNFIMKFKDDLSHWYTDDTLSQELLSVIDEIYEAAIHKWSLSKNFEQSILGVMSK